MLICGIGSSIFHCLAPVLIDSNFSSRNSPLYLGFLAACAFLGPGVGYVEGGQFLNIYVDFYRQEDNLEITPDDPRWVGAWWISYAIGAVLCSTAFVGLIMYPRELPTTAKVQRERKSEVHQDEGEAIANREGFGRSIRDFPLALEILMRNPVFVFNTVGAVFEGMLMTALGTFSPKIIQTLFGRTPTNAAMLVGAVALPGCVVGMVLGGSIPKALKLKVLGMTRMCTLACLVASVLPLALLVLYCDSPPLAGVNVEYFNISRSREHLRPDLSHACNSLCHCTTAAYEPVCGADGSQYFSPCHAGCVTYQGQGNSKIYSNCSCLIPPPSSNLTDLDMIAENGTCASSCPTLQLFLVFMFFLMVTVTIMEVPAMSIGLRCIPDSQRAFGQGIRTVIVRFLGNLTGPIIFGAVFDNACLLWQESCDKQGSCWLYDRAKLAIFATVLIAAIKLASSAAFWVSGVCYKPPIDAIVEVEVNKQDEDYDEDYDAAESTQLNTTLTAI